MIAMLNHVQSHAKSRSARPGTTPTTLKRFGSASAPAPMMAFERFIAHSRTDNDPLPSACAAG
eukprot:29225-Pelagococcus_subviridis.AAC.11